MYRITDENPKMYKLKCPDTMDHALTKFYFLKLMTSN